MRVSLDVPVGEAVSSVGNYVDFNVELQETETTATVNAFTVLLQGARDRSCLPEKWNSSNAKLRLKNSIIDWLTLKKLGWIMHFNSCTLPVYILCIVFQCFYITKSNLNYKLPPASSNNLSQEDENLTI